MNVTIWNENYHEKEIPRVTEVYPGGIHEYLASFIREDGVNVRTVTMDDEEFGLSDEILKDTDVLIWWGHAKHNDVPDEIAERVQQYVLGGMGFIALHSAHHSKPFKRLMGTSANLHWLDESRERVWTVAPNHPIAEGVPESFVLETEEMYGEPFAIPNPDEVIFMGWFKSGNVFRSGCTFTRENGRIFYFQPGHETFESFHNPHVQRIIKNAIKWACPIVKNKSIPVVWEKENCEV